MSSFINEAEKGVAKSPSKVSLEATSSHVSENTPLAPSSLANVTPPHDSYEGFHLWNPTFTWSEDEERKVVWKTDFSLLSAV